MAKKKVTELEEVQSADVVPTFESEAVKLDSENEQIPEDRVEGMTELGLCETETEEQTEGDKGPENSEMEETVPQTETDGSASVNSLIPASPVNADSEESHKIETATNKKSKRKRKTEMDAVSSAENSDQVHSEKRAVVKPKSGVVAIDAVRQVETDADKTQNDLLDLMESMKTGKILSGTIQGVERASERNSTSLAVIYHGAFKVIIPAIEAINPPDDYRGMEPDEVHHYLLTKRLGAEVDYIVKGIDAKAGVAIASRLEAMKLKRKQYYFAADRDGNHILHPDVCAEARVVSVIRAGIFADIFGAEVYIPLRELSYQRVMDASGYFQPGQRILVKVLSVDRIDKENVNVTASVKQAAENPYEKALRRYTVGNRYVGTVSMVDVNGVFVALDGGIDCLCSYPKRGRPPRGARVTVRILGINRETNRIWGAITHIALPR